MNPVNQWRFSCLLVLVFNRKEGGTLRTMTTDKLLKTLPILQDQVDALIEFEATPQDLNNGVINSAFMLLFRDLIRLFACYNDGVINLLGKLFCLFNCEFGGIYENDDGQFIEKYFEMHKKHAREALEIYKKFLIRMDRVADFLKVAEVSSETPSVVDHVTIVLN